MAVLIVPGLYIADDALLSQLREYANLGGHLVLTPRTGYADEEAVARHEVMPGVLRDAAGAHYLHFTNLRSPVGVSGSDGGLTGSATAWADELIPDGATVLARYDHPHLKNFAAITTNVFGSGLRLDIGLVGGEFGVRPNRDDQGEVVVGGTGRKARMQAAAPTTTRPFRSNSLVTTPRPHDRSHIGESSRR